MITVDEAQSCILHHVAALEPEKVNLPDALGRVLREDVRADADMPRFDRSAMDGYAVPAGGDLEGKTLRVVREIQPGGEAGEALEPGACARLYTGAAVPPGARVIRQEDVTPGDGTVTVTRDGGQNHVRRRGEDARRDSLLVPMGQKLTPAHLGILASVGLVRPHVTQSPRIVHLTTGNEIVPADHAPLGTQVRDSNSVLLAALLAGIGARLVRKVHVPDVEAELVDTTRRVLGDGANVLLFSGGASVGDYDFTRRALEATGFTLHFDAVNVRPGRPLLFATRGRQVAFGIPGNPVSHFVCFHLFIAPALAALAGAAAAPPRLSGTLAAPVAAGTLPRETYWPATWEEKPGPLQVRPQPWSSSGHLAALAPVNALLRLPAGAPPPEPGALVEWIPV